MPDQKKEFSGEFQDDEFAIRILRDAQSRPEVTCCKMPTPNMGLSFDVTVMNVGEKDVRIQGSVRKIVEEAKK